MRASLLCLGTLFVVAGCTPATVKTQLVNSEKRATDAEVALDKADSALNALEPEKAEAELRLARDFLADPDIGYYPEHDALFKRLAGAQARLQKTRQQRDQRDFENQVGERQQRIDNAYYALGSAVAALKSRDISRQTLNRAKQSYGELKASLEAAKEYQFKDSTFARHFEKMNEALLDSGPQLQLAELRLVFSETLTPMKHRARELQMEAQASKDRAVKRARIKEAQTKLAQCAKDARSIVERNSKLAHTFVRVDGALTTPQTFIARCATQEKQLQKRLRASASAKKA